MWQSIIRSLPDPVSRRQFLRAASMSVAGVGAASWLPAFAEQVAAQPARRRQCLVLWMAGGPSQVDSFDMKPDHANGGEFRPIATKVPGLQVCEHLPKLAEQMDRLAILRGLSTKEGDHLRGTQLMRTGKVPGGPIDMPSIGCSLAKSLGDPEAGLPSYISVGSGAFGGIAGTGPGYLGPKYAPTNVTGTEPGTTAANNADRDNTATAFATLGVNYLEHFGSIPPTQAERRRAMWQQLQDSFLQQHPQHNAAAQDTVYRRAMRMMDGTVSRAFDLASEPDDVRRAYGPGLFGQGCLLARRLLEQGVPVVEVTLGNTTGAPAGWDTHQNNFAQTRSLLEQLDTGWGTLMLELRERGLLDTTTILWMGEFGRTPIINGNGGRDHFPQAWSCVFAGGGIAGGQAYGATSDDGMEVTDARVNELNVLATLCRALGVDPHTENMTADGRPIKIVDGEAIDAIVT